jgi:DeoR family transcriptional regulator, fructose operon transcriptional repressor
VYAPERHRAIADLVVSLGRASVVELAEHLAVTPETVRRDLSILERQGVLRRVHGGAIPLLRAGFERTVVTRSAENMAEKTQIAQAALEEVPEEGAIIIDAGTTTGALVDALPENRRLTVVTNFLPHAVALADRPGITVLLLGGRVRSTTLACVDEWAVTGLRDIVADVAFIATDGITSERGLTTPDRAEAAVKRAMLHAARRTILLADHSKFGLEHFANFGSLSDVDVVITDAGTDSDLRAGIAAGGPVVVVTT